MSDESRAGLRVRQNQIEREAARLGSFSRGELYNACRKYEITVIEFNELFDGLVEVGEIDHRIGEPGIHIWMGDGK